MISTEQIATLIESPELISGEHLDDLLQLSSKHPYSPIFSMLYLRGLSRSNPLQFEKELSQQAFVLPSRSRLFELVHDMPKIETSVTEEEVTQKETSVKDLSTEEPVLAEETVEEAVELTLVPEIIEEEVPTLEKVAEEIQVISESETVEEESQRPTIPLDELDKNILSYAVDATISYELAQMEKEAALKEKQEAKEREEQIKPAIELEEKTIISTTGTKSFTDWLRPFIHEEVGDKLNEEEAERTERSKKIIAAFNQEDLKKSTPKKEFFSPAKKAKESLDESGLPVSETLAKIYAAQGNFPRAITAYEQLMLKIPEKKSFFVLQIEKLKKNLNE